MGGECAMFQKELQTVSGSIALEDRRILYHLSLCDFCQGNISKSPVMIIAFLRASFFNSFIS